ncbi:uncharacterized protein GIQ15_06990 [Arthroderma uncinatum]|uniref:uncharacterized protein n=1 Tax=Arthroderma uncinatum TaxID=74035 RepID=UPI00144ABEAF|nr:uncharacterized protein GIQ15_06990 [Arthroderma uncinatum]KAF3480014.1 hypothetical protein GIQ15_06990 [Arthroderma uncinatum]
MHASQDGHRLSKPNFEQRPPQSIGEESSHSYLRPDPLRIHKAHSSPLPGVFSNVEFAHDNARSKNHLPYTATSQGESSHRQEGLGNGANFTSLEESVSRWIRHGSPRSRLAVDDDSHNASSWRSMDNTDQDARGLSSSNYHHPRQHWQYQTREDSRSEDPNWKGKGVMPVGEDEPQPFQPPLGSHGDRPLTEQQDVYLFGSSAEGAYRRTNIDSPDTGIVQARNLGVEQRFQDMSIDHHSMAPDQTPVAYGLPPLGGDNAAMQTDLESENNLNKTEKKLSVLDLVSGLRNGQ